MSPIHASALNSIATRIYDFKLSFRPSFRPTFADRPVSRTSKPAVDIRCREGRKSVLGDWASAGMTKRYQTQLRSLYHPREWRGGSGCQPTGPAPSTGKPLAATRRRLTKTSPALRLQVRWWPLVACRFDECQNAFNEVAGTYPVRACATNHSKPALTVSQTTRLLKQQSRTL